MNPTLDELISLAELMYVRMEAEQLIDDCLNKFDPAPFNKLLEELVLAGSGSILVLREILNVIRSIMTGLNQEGLDVRQDLKDALAEFGVQLPLLSVSEASDSFWRFWRHDLNRKVREDSEWLAQEERLLLEEICIEADKRVALIAQRLVLLKHLEESVQDWIASLAYEIARSPDQVPWIGQQFIKH